MLLSMMSQPSIGTRHLMWRKVRGEGHSQCLWAVVLHPAAFIEHLLCAARGGAWGWETKPHTIPSLPKHTELIPSFI